MTPETSDFDTRNAWRRELLDAYRTYRVEDQVTYYERRTTQYERARRWAVTGSAFLLVLAALFGALAAADAGSRGLWAFVAAALSALATALVSYEAAFGFERLSHEYADTRSALALADVKGPRASDLAAGNADDVVKRYITGMEALMRAEVDTWSQGTDVSPTDRDK